LHREEIITLAELYSTHVGLKLSTVSSYAANDGKILPRLTQGRDVTTTRAKALGRWFSDNWPDDLEWPASISRPSQAQGDAA